jgi:carboxyl-terminal processing protease
MRLSNKRIAFPFFAAGVALVLAATGASSSTAAAPSSPFETGAQITRLTTNLLESSQFEHRPLDDRLASTFLDRYLDSLDGSRSLFLETDVDEFGAYRATLAHATRDEGDTSAARVIFSRYLERVQQRAAYFTDTLKTTRFDFSGHDALSLDREHAQRPRDLAAARARWGQELRADYLQEKLADKRPEQIVSTLTHRYAQQLQTMKAFTDSEVLEVYLNALAHVYDPHSDYLGREQADSFASAMSLSLVGIGASLEATDGYCKIRELIPGGPAARAGVLKPGDRIVAVAQAGKEPVDITNVPLSRAVELIRGAKGTTVTLTVLPAGTADGSPPETMSLVRDNVELADQEAKSRIVDLPNGNGATVRLGVIELPGFYADMGEQAGASHRSATADVARLLDKLKAEHVRGVILDLRHNGGGSLQEAVSLTGLFIRTGPVVQTRDRGGDVEVDADEDPAVAYDGPLVVLTSRFTASASEIVAGALQDYGRALVVGDTSTFGKGTVQNVLPLGNLMDKLGLAHAYDPGALKITIRKFYRPGGASTQLRGVAADIVLPSTSDLGEVSESALKDPLPWDSVPSKPYEHLDMVAPYVAVLRESSARRVAKDRGFHELQTDVVRLREVLAAKSLSLNEPERRAELSQAKARRLQREREDESLRTARPRTYEITLERASSPGLPAPLAVASPAKRASSAGRPAGTTVDEGATDASLGEGTVLDESERILADYVELLSRKSAGSTEQAARSPLRFR